MPGRLACQRAPSEVQYGVSNKKLTEGGKIAGCQHIMIGLIGVCVPGTYHLYCFGLKGVMILEVGSEIGGTNSSTLASFTVRVDKMAKF